ncbi:MAG TPA: hypothetical protein VHJ18_22860 [Streptosporangiaceae bacterium]|jgi:hypothetical protein|nr:hypothetical protein [Streptosporangiaceae bacterium]
MFVADEVPLSIGIDAARMRLANLISGGMLDTASREIYLEHGVALLPVGPARGLSRLVQVRMRGLVTHGDTTVLPLRWEAGGTTGNLFPVLDADLSLRPAGHQAVLRLDGTYRPPLRAVGAALDRAVLRHVAQGTIRAFVRQVASALTSPEQVPAASPARQLPASPQPRPGGPAG